jgi:hypothetical protein
MALAFAWTSALIRGSGDVEQLSCVISRRSVVLLSQEEAME